MNIFYLGSHSEYDNDVSLGESAYEPDEVSEVEVLNHREQHLAERKEDERRNNQRFAILFDDVVHRDWSNQSHAQIRGAAE